MMNAPPSPLAIAKDANASLISANCFTDNSTSSVTRGGAAEESDEEEEEEELEEEFDGAIFGGI